MTSHQTEPTAKLPSSAAGEARAFVTRVRAALSDLPADELDELTGGMQADLEDLAAEGGGLARRLGSPEVYAAELRAAAGYPPRVATAPPSGVARRLAGVREGWANMTRQPWWSAAAVPALWFGRGVVVAWVLGNLLGLQAAQLVWFAACGALSVWVGWATRGITGTGRRLLQTVNLVCALLGVVFLASAWEPQREDYPVTVVEQPQDGLRLDGEPARGLVVYDAEGKVVDRARILDQQGRNLPVEGDASSSPPATLPALPPISPTANVPEASTTAAPTAPTGGTATTPTAPASGTTATPAQSAPAPTPTTPASQATGVAR